MLYVQQSLGPDERLVHIGRFHWLFNLYAAMGILWGLFIAIIILVGAVFVQINMGPDLTGGVPYRADDSWYTMVVKIHPAVKIVALMMFVMGLLKFAHMMVIRATTEIAVTSNRIIYKRGLVARYVGEISIDRIEGVNVIQTVMGRLFNYGSVIIRGMGVGEVVLPPLADPIRFRRAIEYARTI